MKTQLKDLLTRFQSSGSKVERAIVQKGNSRTVAKRRSMRINPVSPMMNRRTIH